MKPLPNPHAVIDHKSGVSVGFVNVYEEGDYWKKVIGCEGCETRCCTNCRCLTPDNMCSIHMKDPELKPVQCVAWPPPSLGYPGCQQVFECVRGSDAILGKFRRVDDAHGPQFRGEAR